MGFVARTLDRLAAEGVADPQRLAEMAEWLRVNRPAEEADAPPGAPRRSHPRDILSAWLRVALDRGYTLESLAQVIGITRERVRQLSVTGHPVSPADVPPVVGVRISEDLPWPTVPRRWHIKIRPELSVEAREELVELQRLGTQVRGNCSANDPRRVASELLSAKLADLIDRQGFTYRELGDILGLTAGAIRARLSVHGYRNLPPSRRRKRYQGGAVA